MDKDPTSLVRVGLKLFSHITNQWQAKDEQKNLLLGLKLQSKFPVFPPPQIEEVPQKELLLRLSMIQNIYSLLHLIFENKDQADSWPNKPNKAFGGKSALEEMATDDLSGLIAVRSYLEKQLM